MLGNSSRAARTSRRGAIGVGLLVRLMRGRRGREHRTMNYYNEIDPFCAQWLRNLIKADLISKGEVDERSIEDVKPDQILQADNTFYLSGHDMLGIRPKPYSAICNSAMNATHHNDDLQAYEPHQAFLFRHKPHMHGEHLGLFCENEQDYYRAFFWHEFLPDKLSQLGVAFYENHERILLYLFCGKHLSITIYYVDRYQYQNVFHKFGNDALVL